MPVAAASPFAFLGSLFTSLLNICSSFPVMNDLSVFPGDFETEVGGELEEGLEGVGGDQGAEGFEVEFRVFHDVFYFCVLLFGS